MQALQKCMNVVRLDKLAIGEPFDSRNDTARAARVHDTVGIRPPHTN
jgi:hypothetical protein